LQDLADPVVSFCIDARAGALVVALVVHVTDVYAHGGLLCGEESRATRLPHPGPANTDLPSALQKAAALFDQQVADGLGAYRAMNDGEQIGRVGHGAPLGGGYGLL
jgi:hypothetical protein